ncbi:hypothetical protein M271_49365 [Streptomyces rapamycinicus NRRL 5491]|uniref:PAS domain-containing protein n=2 Tax=Streptomyces rapamycinicus TaxID=1226757 RepID=A0A0A0NXB4_STRRN|nr:SpoIIE family protein phosphatase [Streptomyces rapamycinicus]AGP61235.1 hypothetical protein M271_49365 [Streptomyces rapamycinicus NRRL 5491]MBB4787587.1 PAS domain S-box-containing protein [Streptomyces rapamycinicus]RLV71929.1 hypothetical protein D3C57_145420 [Streptomyces rapamycinicus NRRL 5491]
MTGQCDGAEPFSLDGIAMAVINREGIVLRWTRAAEELLGRTATEVCGRPVAHLLANASERHRLAEGGGAGIPEAGRATLRHHSGDTVEVAFRVRQLEPRSEFAVLAAPIRCVTDWEQSVSLLRALLGQDRVGIGIHDPELRVVRTNITSEMSDGPGLPIGGRLADVMSAEDAEAAEAALRQVLSTGVPLVGREHRTRRSTKAPERQGALSLSAFRLDDERGHPAGVAVFLHDAADRLRALRDLELRHRASAHIGTSLDVTRTAQDMADILVPALGDLAWVELADAVFEGDEPPKVLGGGDPHMRRAAVAPAGTCPLLPPGAAVPRLRDALSLRSVQRGKAIITDRAETESATGRKLARLFVPEHGHSAMWVPLFARGLLLGTVGIWRTEQPEPFRQEDAELLTEIATRAALSVDNARRYTREHRAAVALQQRLLPHATTDTAAAHTVGLYKPAGGGSEISGDWFDVIPLPSLRAAFLVGDVIGHGLHATATMGRLSTAVQTLADLELPPDELLTRLDDLVTRLASEATPAHEDTIGATCLYALYDPITCLCTLASSGHPPPVLIHPDGTAHPVALSPGPPLGVGGLPFETTTLELAPGSVLALYTDGLLDRSDHDAGLQRLTDRLAALCRPGVALDDLGRAAMADAIDSPPRDDIALLLVRTRALAPDATSAWEFPADPAVVADAREATSHQLTVWGLDEAAFTTELIVSELVTNAIRYAGGPMELRLIRDKVLICEVSDPSNTHPRLRRAHITDEGGRGLFLVAQLTRRWGIRYGRSGKTIWAELPLHPMPAERELRGF